MRSRLTLRCLLQSIPVLLHQDPTRESQTELPKKIVFADYLGTIGFCGGGDFGPHSWYVSRANTLQPFVVVSVTKGISLVPSTAATKDGAPENPP